MIDSTTHDRITVATDGDAGPYIMVPLDQLPAVEELLRNDEIPFWVDQHAISLNGEPAVVVVNLGRGAEARHVQRLLDAAA